jgi:hypothetical protein
MVPTDTAVTFIGSTTSIVLTSTVDAAVVTITDIVNGSATETITSTTAIVFTSPPTTALLWTPVSLIEFGDYELYFSETGVKINPNNPGNTVNPLVKTELDGSLSQCNAASPCATNRINAINDDLCNAYISFNLQFRISTGVWECVSYFNPNKDASYFNVEDPDEGTALGYNIPPNS